MRTNTRARQAIIKTGVELVAVARQMPMGKGLDENNVLGASV
ncbi:hypothetical protein [Pseudarthrobacter sp. BRE9]|nr:hypothetical protein [Pseudarthrobacter sp. BRE9]MDT0169482.1 hypothetical protein [Pseudarthrobacter sp. BRE9]